MTGYMSWREVHEMALSETKNCFSQTDEQPSKGEFVGLYTEFYDETVANHTITSWPVDPAGSRRMAKGRATTVWADDYSG